MKFDELPQPETRDIVSPDTLAVDGDNPNEQSDEMFGLLCDNMRTKGWLGNDIIADTDGLIADGEHRWRAAQEIGLEGVPVKFFDIDDSERRLWRQELNKISGEHDTKRDALEYQTLLDNGKSESVDALVDATDEDLDELLEEIRMDKSTPAPYEYDCEHTVYFEDCVQGMQDRLDDDSVDCVITDPPYGVNANLGSSVTMSHDEFEVDREMSKETVENDGLNDALQIFEDTVKEITRIGKDDVHIYAFAVFRTYDKFRNILEKYGFKVQNCLVWVKNDSTPIRAWTDEKAKYAYNHEFILFAVGDSPSELQVNGDPDDVLKYPSGRYADEIDGVTDHPTQKPLAMISELVQNSTKKSDRILDPFMGSGTTAVAAIQNDRDYIGFEIDEDNYRSVIERRISEAKRQVNANAN
ncbi:adenine methyltransferase [environmental Halophage eHP-2]|nr:adenine methyltransferase [environmental Halophage eHP-2]